MKTTEDLGQAHNFSINATYSWQIMALPSQEHHPHSSGLL